MMAKGRNWAILLGVLGVLFFAGAACADSMDSKYVLPEEFSWYGESGALRAPVYTEGSIITTSAPATDCCPAGSGAVGAVKEGLWWMPDSAPAGQENTQWGNRGYIFVGGQARPPVVAAAPAPVVAAAPSEKIVYVDRVVEKPVDRIVYVDRDRVVEKTVIQYVDRPVEPKTVKLLDVFFDYDKSSLTPLARKTLTDNMAVLKDNPEVKVLLIGSASPEGTNNYNQKLSQRRVNSVGEWFLNAGLSQDRFLTDAIGEVEVAKVANYPSARKVQVNITPVEKK